MDKVPLLEQEVVEESMGSSDRARRRVDTVKRMSEPKPSAVFDTYWRFTVERQEIYRQRVEGFPAPWTKDPILLVHKFTNAYRAADRVSQYLIKEVIYSGDFDVADAVLRILFFKIFNKISTWQFVAGAIGELNSKSFKTRELDGILSVAMETGTKIYSGAYIMPSGPMSIRQPRKHRMHLQLLDTSLRGGLVNKLCGAKSMSALYESLLGISSFGPFLAYQFATDLAYSPHFNFSEMEFVVPGPGAKDGMRKCFENFGEYSEPEVIRWMAERQADEFAKRGLQFRNLWGRPLQLIDCQNLFCEVDKYARVAHPNVSGISGRTRIKQRYDNPKPMEAPFFPPKWGVNPHITPPRAGGIPDRTRSPRQRVPGMQAALDLKAIS